MDNKLKLAIIINPAARFIMAHKIWAVYDLCFRDTLYAGNMTSINDTSMVVPLKQGKELDLTFTASSNYSISVTKYHGECYLFMCADE